MKGEMDMEWISVKDRLPEYSIRLFVYTDNGFTTMERMRWPKGKATWDFLVGDKEIIGRITRWMPLPEPPKERDDE